MSQHIFEYVPHSTTVFTSEYLCNYEERLQLNFSSCLNELQEIHMNETEGEVNLTVNTELEAENDYDLDEDIDQVVCIFEFTDIPFYVAVVTLSLNEPVYVIEGEFYLPGNYLKIIRSKESF